MISLIKKDILSSFLTLVIDYRGKTPKKLGSDWKESGYRAISANNVKTNGLQKLDSIRYVDEETYKKWMKVEVERGDLLLTSEAPAGEIMLWDSDEKIVLSQRLFALRVNDRIYNRFLKYYLQSELGQKEILKNTSGSTVFGISAKMFDSINIHYPDKTEQFNIGDFLSDLDAKIEINNKINAELEAMTKLVYDYWFVQFDFPDTNGKPYKASGGKMVYNKQLKREIPQGWEVETLGSALNVVLGGTPSTKHDEYWNGDIPWLNSGEIANFPIIDSEEKVTQEGIDNSATVIMPKGSCVLSITRHLRASILAIDSCANQSVVGLLETDELKSAYLYPYLLNELPRLMSLRTGAQQPHINKGTVEESYILIPEEGILESYYSTIESFFEQIINHSKQNQNLTELLDWLLPMLMNGQVKVVQNEKDILKELFPEANLFAEVAALQFLDKKANNFSHGKTYIQKTMSHLKDIKREKRLKHVEFEEYHWGMFSKTVAKSIDGNPFLCKETTPNGKNILKVKASKIKELSKWMSLPENQGFVKSVEELISLYQEPLIANDVNRIELLNTVHRCMTKLNSDELVDIRNEMRNWKMQESSYKNKFEKFTENETLHMIGFIKDILKQ